MSRYHFKSKLFEIEPGEDEETNPGVYGKQLARWLKSNFESLGYKVEKPIPEDWGWCIMCSRHPYRLWLGCANVSNFDSAKPNRTASKKDDMLWYCFPMAEAPFLKRLFRMVDTFPGLKKLDSQLQGILRREPDVELLDEI